MKPDPYQDIDHDPTCSPDGTETARYLLRQVLIEDLFNSQLNWRVLEVIDATTYLISYNNKEVEAKSSDYAIYKVGERVTILKGVEHPEDSMTWEDLKDYDAELWSIIPVIFYHKEEVT